MTNTTTPQHPGLTIAEEIKTNGLTIGDVARVAGMKRENLSPVLNGRRELTRAAAYRIDAAILALVDVNLERQAETWIKQQAAYDWHNDEEYREGVYTFTFNETAPKAEKVLPPVEPIVAKVSTLNVPPLRKGKGQSMDYYTVITTVTKPDQYGEDATWSLEYGYENYAVFHNLQDDDPEWYAVSHDIEDLLAQLPDEIEAHFRAELSKPVEKPKGKAKSEKVSATKPASSKTKDRVVTVFGPDLDGEELQW